jgi:ppGpp synthetase/RelA/SpoT-type nucleotidyltranferase
MISKLKKAVPNDDLLAQALAAYPATQLPGYWAALEANCVQWAIDLSNSEFWRRAREELEKWRQDYHSHAKVSLLTTAGLPNFVHKSSASVKNKLMRRLQDRKPLFINEQDAIPGFGDLVRIRIVCSYLDGVEFIAKKIVDLAASSGLEPTLERQGSLNGYFAQHVNCAKSQVFRLGGAEKLVVVGFEVQIATEFATRMWDATHALYEADRVRDVDPSGWQWDASDPRFLAHQLGHMMHLADGLLVQLRNGQH